MVNVFPREFVAENMTNVVEVIKLANNYSQGLVGMGILLILFGGIFFILSTFSTENALMVSGFVTTIMAFFLHKFQMINEAILAVLISITLISIVVSAIDKFQG